VLYKPIDERAAVIDVLPIDSYLRVLDASHEGAGIGQVDLETAESDEDYLAGYLSDSANEGVGVSCFSTWSAMEKARGKQSHDRVCVPPRDCVRNLYRRGLHSAIRP
jgi:hypothetical protein